MSEVPPMVPCGCGGYHPPAECPRKSPKPKLIYKATILHNTKCKTPEAPGGKCHCDARELKSYQAHADKVERLVTAATEYEAARDATMWGLFPPVDADDLLHRVDVTYFEYRSALADLDK